MALKIFSAEARLRAARNLFEQLARGLDAPISVRLWDGSVIPLGSDVLPGYALSVRSAEALGALLRRPSLENLVRAYASGDLDLHGAQPLEFARAVREKRVRFRIAEVRSLLMLRNLIPLLLAPSPERKHMQAFEGDEHGSHRVQADDKDFIHFHYDVSNEFYALFLDPEMVYTCAYFRDPEGSLEQAQLDKMEITCRKLQLKPGERLLDIGCGWGGLICYAARNFDVEAVGITLSEEQYRYAQTRIEQLGLQDRVRVELIDYRDVKGPFDKVVTVGMIEAVALADRPAFYAKIHSLLRDRGILLHHGITNRAKKPRRRRHRLRGMRDGKKLLLKYIFPGYELEPIGQTLDSLERTGFEIHDVEGWREHYAMTTEQWCHRLWARREEAEAIVGSERTRIWLAYLAGVSLAFRDGSTRIYQVVASVHARRDPSPLPLTREGLYPSPRS